MWIGHRAGGPRLDDTGPAAVGRRLDPLSGERAGHQPDLPVDPGQPAAPADDVNDVDDDR